jgi:hypothetical protein
MHRLAPELGNLSSHFRHKPGQASPLFAFDWWCTCLLLAWREDSSSWDLVDSRPQLCAGALIRRPINGKKAYVGRILEIGQDFPVALHEDDQGA